MATSTTIGATRNKYIDGLLSGRAWTGLLTFGFPEEAAVYDSLYGAGEPYSGFAALAPAGRDAVRAALLGTPNGSGNAALQGMGIAQFTQLDITEGDSGADLRIAESARPPTAWAYYPGAGTGGDVWFGTAYAGTVHDFRSPTLGNYAYVTVLHELGHALGLKHAQEGGGPGATAVPADRDSLEFTVMTYRSYIGAPTSGYSFEQWGAPQSYMMLDIAALQAMYGADFGTRTGDTIYSWNPLTGEMSVDGTGQGRPGGNRIFLTTWDGGGRDTYDLSDYANGVNVDLAPGGWSILSGAQLAKLGNTKYARGNVFNALQYQGDRRSLIEDAIGGIGNDTLRGNVAANLLQGGAGNDSLSGLDGNDTLEGGAGKNTLVGGAGDDSYIVSSTTDVLIEAAAAGTDTVITSLAWTLGANFETLILTGDAKVNGTGNPLRNLMQGNVGDNLLSGAAGNDTLLGAEGNDTLNGGLGANQLHGGPGDDTYVVSSAMDAIFEAPNDGRDRVVTTLSFTLPDDIERLEFTGTAAAAGTGNATANVILGNAGLNRLSGLDGNDSLSGDRGADTLLGGGGDDTLVGGAGADQLTGGAGADHFLFLRPDDGFDTILDFDGTSDCLAFSGMPFGLTAGIDLQATGRLTLNATGSAVGTAAQFVYNTTTHILCWDMNGAASGGVLRLVMLRDAVAVTAADFIVIA
ncbi:M10 family metallopeptidase [Roseicella aerolata]|uniref:M10 family metallopeptidase C-terminal domain-containing protein n=1 Tax=Roseicella aerolata TaxID=2883479 RepID=A0A9X1IAB0_9PROT|nr:M10 family metallopeptidase [Roseicella aerolata]MCB4821130.1 M10 family metallopeptidase C-terminal domain-containing protein [Roseicella aerolata]